MATPAIIELTPQDILILKNAASMAECLVIDPGKNIVCKNAAKGASVLLSAMTSAEFPKQICVADVSKFIAVLDSLESPQLQLDDDFMILSSKGSKAKYRYVYAELAAVEPWICKHKSMPINSAADAEFVLTKDDLNSILSACRILKLEALYIESSDEGVRVVARKEVVNNEVDRKKVFGSDHYELQVEGATSTGEWSAPLRVADLKLIADDYKLSVHLAKNERCVAFEGVNRPIKYWIRLQQA